MPTATQAKVFNYDLFKKRVRLFDSDSDGERNLAFTQAVRQCAEHNPPLKFYEAASQAFPSGRGKADEELEREIARLERIADALGEQMEINAELKSEISRLEDAGETLANALAEQQEINAELRNRRQRSQGSNAGFHSGS